jgi:hypothetical protein
MSKTNKHKAHSYAIVNGEDPHSIAYKTTVHDFISGYNEGLKADEQLRRDLLHAKRLLRDSFKLPQNQPWNSLYEKGEDLRQKIHDFLAK